jgi:hypothetical protein
MKFSLSCPDNPLLPTRCRVAATLNPSGSVEIAIMEEAGNNGRSLSNSWPQIAAWVLAHSLPTLQVEEAVWYEVYPGGREGKEAVHRVVIKNGSHRLEYEKDPVVRKRVCLALGLYEKEMETRLSDRAELSFEYLESIRNHVAEGGRLDHESAIELLDELGLRHNALIEECAVAAEQACREWINNSVSDAILKKLGDAVRNLKSSPLNSRKMRVFFKD